MLMSSILVFDDYVFVPVLYTADTVQEHLGRYDLLSIQAIVEEVNIAGSLSVQIFHSADARNFIAKSAQAEIFGNAGQGPGQGKLNTGTTNVLYGADGSNLPSLAFVRLAISLGNGASFAKVRIYVSSREQGGGGGTDGMFLGMGSAVELPSPNKG